MSDKGDLLHEAENGQAGPQVALSSLSPVVEERETPSPGGVVERRSHSYKAAVDDEGGAAPIELDAGVGANGNGNGAAGVAETAFPSVQDIIARRKKRTGPIAAAATSAAAMARRRRSRAEGGGSSAPSSATGTPPSGSNPASPAGSDDDDDGGGGSDDDSAPARSSSRRSKTMADVPTLRQRPLVAQSAPGSRHGSHSDLTAGNLALYSKQFTGSDPDLSPSRPRGRSQTLRIETLSLGPPLIPNVRVRRADTCTSQSFHNDMADLIPELREHRSAALHESRTSIGRSMSSHTKAVMLRSDTPDQGASGESETDVSGAGVGGAGGSGSVTPKPGRLLRWRSLEDMDIQLEKAQPSPTDGSPPHFEVHTHKKRGTQAAEAAFHPGGAQSDHEASCSESEVGKSSDEEEDEMLERILEAKMQEHGIALSPTMEGGQAARVHQMRHRERHQVAEGLRLNDYDDGGGGDGDGTPFGGGGGIPGSGSGGGTTPGGMSVGSEYAIRRRGTVREETSRDEEKRTAKNIHLTLSSMRRSIGELVLIADSLDVRVQSSAQHLRKCSYNLLESMVAVKEHIYQHIHLLKYRNADMETRGRGMLADLRLQHASRNRAFAALQPGTPRRQRGMSSASRESGDVADSVIAESIFEEKFPQAAGILREHGGVMALAGVGLFVLIVLFLAASRQPSHPHDPLKHVYFAAGDHNGTIHLDSSEPMDWIELIVQLPGVETNHDTSRRESVVFELQSRPKDHSLPWSDGGQGAKTCRQSKDGVKRCFFEGYTDLDTSLEWQFFFYLVDPVSDHEGMSFIAHVAQMDWVGKAKLYFCAFILIGSLVTIAKEWIHRTLVAFVGSLLVLGLLLWCNLFPDLQTVVEWVDEGTLALLFGMMIIVGRLAETGFFQVATARVLPYSKGSSFRLAVILCLLSGILSAFLDNVTTMILLAPITIELAQALQCDPVPYLIAETLFSNVGGAATLIGDPPNIIVGSAFPEITFVDFLANMLPGIVLMYGPLLLYLKYNYRKELGGRLEHFNDGLEVAQQYVITDWPLLQRSLIVLGVVLVAFVTHSVHHVNPAWAAVLGAIALMLASNPHEVDHALESVEWDVLLFFAALFIMVEGVAELGFIRFIGGIFEDAIRPAPEEDRIRVAVTLLIWISSIVSAFLDNIPYTATMIPVIAQLADEDDGLGLDLKTLAWALCFGACLGGNGSLIGASANIVVSSIAHRSGHQLSFGRFFKTSFPFMLVSVAMSHVYMLARYTS